MAVSPLSLPFDPNTGALYESVRNPRLCSLSTKLHGIARGDTLALRIYAGRIDSLGWFRSVGDLWQGSESLDLEFSTAQPVRGHLVYTIAGASTGELPSDHSSYELRVALNRLPAINSAGGVSVLERAGKFRVLWNDAGARADVLTVASVQGQSMTGAVSVIQTGDGSTREIREIDTRVALIASATGFATPSAPSLDVTVLAEGSATQQEVTKIQFSRAPSGGTWCLSADAGSTYSAPISAHASSWAVHAALDAQESGVWTVEKPDALTWIVTHSERAVHADMMVDAGGIVPHVARDCSLDLSALPALLDRVPPLTALDVRLVIRSGSSAATLFSQTARVFGAQLR